jgi:hypothetical protein
MMWNAVLWALSAVSAFRFFTAAPEHLRRRCFFEEAIEINRK